MKLHKDDLVNPYGVVTKISDYYVWFGSKRYSINTINNKSRDIHFKNSPDTIVDWTNEHEVDNYYKSFSIWSTAVRMEDTRKLEILEIKDNKVLKDGEYYLPFKYIDAIPSKAVYEDGYIWGVCLKKNNAWYETMEGPVVNIFMVDSLISEDEMQAQKLKEKLFETTDILTYLRSINPQFINSKDLDLFKKHITELLNPFLPYIYKAKKSVIFKEGMFGVEIHHRNRIGLLKVDNGYHGLRPYRNDYDLMLEVSPCFTNEAKYYCSEYNVKFSIKLLDSIAKCVIKKWDSAIENNARYIG